MRTSIFKHSTHSDKHKYYKCIHQDQLDSQYEVQPMKDWCLPPRFEGVVGFRRPSTNCGTELGSVGPLSTVVGV